MFRSLSLVAIALLLGAPAYAQDASPEIDEIFSWATLATPGCAVAVSRHGELVVNRAYGMADLERDVPITPSTIFDIGSVQKQFTAAAILLLVDEGRLALSDDVREHVPELPDYGHTVTLDHLLTHTSGIRDWTGMLPLAADDPDALTLTLRQRGLNFAPGEEWSYSSSGYELLKEVVARTSGLSFAEFARQRLFEPLGMTRTAYRHDPRAGEDDLAHAYDKEGDVWKRDMLVGNDRGGGALLTTASDLIIWNQALASARFGGFVSEKLQEQATLNNGRELAYGRALFVDTNRGGRFVWHTGSAAGYKALLARYPEQGLSIAILCNAGETANRTLFARRIFDLFVPGDRSAGSDAPAAVAEAADVPAPDLSDRAGLFFSERDGQPLRLIVRNGRLGIVGGGPLVAVDGDRFRNPRGSLSFMSQDEFELRFLSPDELQLTSMEGETTRVPPCPGLGAHPGRTERVRRAI